MDELKKLLKDRGITPEDLLEDPVIGELTQIIILKAKNRDIVDAINEIELALAALVVEFERRSS